MFASTCPQSVRYHCRCELGRPISVSKCIFNLSSRRSSAKSVHGKCVSQAQAAGEQPGGRMLRTCRSCKQQFDPLVNHPRACRFHTAHFGGETKRKFESVYTGGTLDTVGGGEILQYWHCCGVSDPFDAGCEAAPHMSYDD